MFHYFDNTHLYTAHEMQRIALSPVNAAARVGKEVYSHPLNPLAYTQFGRHMAASAEMLERMTRHFSKPDFNIHETHVGQRHVKIKYRIVKRKTFGRVLHFKKVDYAKPQISLLIVAPLSGHYSTLLRGTVEALLPHYDVYITDWQNAQDVPLAKGKFDLDDYVEYLMEFMRFLGPNLHVMAVCQPAVPVLAAVSLMSTKNDPLLPKSMTLIGGPIDTRKNPTEVNKLAETRTYHWFENNVISKVPFNYPGFGRKVYPGFLQLTGFMSMNLDRHIDAHRQLFEHLVDGDGESAEAHKKFYNEYLSVLDIPAEFYLQTIKTVFQEHALPKGTMTWKGKPVRPQDITKTALLAIEGGRDDISGRGQTKAALDLCTKLPESKKHYHLQKDVGHYGTFNGRKFREHIVPAIQEFIKNNHK